MIAFRWFRAVLLATFALGIAGVAATLFGQAPSAAAPASNPSADTVRAALLGNLIKRIKDFKQNKDKTHSDEEAESRAEQELPRGINVFIAVAADPTLLSFLRSEVQEWRTDVQTENPPSGNGTTSAVSKGSVPYLLGLAVENGALTQMTSGTKVTFRTNPTGLITALQKHGYAESGPDSYTDPVVKFVKNFSAAVTFNTGNTSSTSSISQGSQTGTLTGSTQQISSFDVRYDIYNHRDPRDSKYATKWESLRVDQLTDLANKRNEFTARVKGISPLDDAERTKYQAWETKVIGWIKDADANVDDSAPNSVQSVVYRIAADFGKTFADDPNVKAAADAAVRTLTDYLKTAGGIRDLISKSPIVTLEYADILQGSIATAMASMSPQATTTSTNLPSLSNFKLIVAGGTVGGTTLTANASLTIFNSIPAAATKTGRVRDFQLSGEADVPLKEIGSLGVPTLTFSGLFLSLQQQPLGMPIEVNGVQVNMKGNLGLAQAKISFPVKKGSGVRVPLSITYASRTEFNREHDVSGQIGVTFNLDSVFAAMKP